ncbi:MULTISPECIES: hypothetical protein [unclassified Rhizobacter]|uniref:hypothetical protein n=1 Tax=unclassified Rhizobacter TaxID=2640088 RepID=UPI0006FE0B0A|nr:MULTISPECIES: hypothetical protein [unclassified Rhizobacter]KQU69127.1 hypothetical protein ASC88_28755 [Rhizobacter sp. Root29]KQW03931.1 hypothetical protein ASC98_26925 [Rhizobacter sp. Root1238]KRB21572.1 hypothetical protein ASE08_21610 [Rhizobacter sp. Root16D2]
MATIKSTERDDSSFPHLYQLNGRYRIDPANSNDDLLNDVGCLLEAVEGVLQGIVDNNDDTSTAVLA